MTDSDVSPALEQVRAAIAHRSRFAITSHLQPDGDAIGSSLAMASALRAIGKQVQVVLRDPPPDAYGGFPAVSEIVQEETIGAEWPTIIVMECGSLERTGLTGLENRFVINVDHHLGNTMFGSVNWFDESAAACGEMVYDIIRALDVPISEPIATHLYLAILTDTGAFHHSNITSRTFELARRVAEAGVDPARIARLVFNSSSLGKVKMAGQLLSSMELAADDRLAILNLDEATLAATGCDRTDTEGLINMPLMARVVRAVVMFKDGTDGRLRVSLRSKEQVDVRSVAQAYGGGGHRNAAGFTAEGTIDTVKPTLIARLQEAIERGTSA